MAKQIQKAKPTISVSGKKAVKTVKNAVTWEFPLKRQNVLWISIGIGAVVLGYILMATGITQDPALPSAKWNNPFAVQIAPVLMVIGYCVLIPYGLLKQFAKKPQEPQAE